METKEELQAMRDRLSKALATVPESVKSGSVQLVRDYKESYVKAAKVLAKKNSAFAALHTAAMKMETFK